MNDFYIGCVHKNRLTLWGCKKNHLKLVGPSVHRITIITIIDMPPPNHWRHPFHFLLPIFIIGAPLFGVVNAFHNNNNNNKYNHSGHQHHQHQAMTKKVRASTIVTEIRMSNLNIDSSSDCISNDVGTSPNNTNLSSTTLQPIKAGFIGLGTIASSIATALASSSHAPYLSQYASLSLHSIAVTKRSDSKSSKLRQTFPDVVTIYDSAVDVVRNSNEVFLCVLPQQVDEVLAELRKSNVWRKEDHTLVSLVVRLLHSISRSIFYPPFVTHPIMFLVYL